MDNTGKIRTMVNGAAGRIGAAVTYEMITQSKNLDVVLLNEPLGIDALVQRYTTSDPVHGTFEWSVQKLSDNTISINGHTVVVTNERSLSGLPLKELDIEYAAECSGFYAADKNDPTRRPCDEFFQHGVKKVIQSYPAKADKTLVMGVNHREYNHARHHLISNGSCTTKALVQPLKVLVNEGISIDRLLMDTTHAATPSEKEIYPLLMDVDRANENGQKILEALRIATHKTGAAIASAEVLPELKGKMDGFAMRVPTRDGSFANLFFAASATYALDANNINDLFKRSVNDNRYKGRIAVIDDKEANSSDHIIGFKENSRIVLSKTRVFELPYNPGAGLRSHLVGIVSGYDNERAPPLDLVMVLDYMASKTR